MLELNYKEIIEQYKNQKSIETNKDNPYLLANYGYQILELERTTCKELTYIRLSQMYSKSIVLLIGNVNKSF